MIMYHILEQSYRGQYIEASYSSKLPAHLETSPDFKTSNARWNNLIFKKSKINKEVPPHLCSLAVICLLPRLKDNFISN